MFPPMASAHTEAPAVPQVQELQVGGAEREMKTKEAYRKFGKYVDNARL